MKEDSESKPTTDRARRAGSSRVVNDLHRFGPEAAGEPLSVEASVDYCRRLAMAHYENFSVASWLLPRRIRKDFYAIYAYCRWSDDLADELDDPDRSRTLLDWWLHSLQGCFDGQPCTHPVFVALGPAIDRYRLSIEPFQDLISAFVDDQTIQRYDTDVGLRDYCRRSANPVGRILLRIANIDSDETLRLSDSICTGLQLANFCQDLRIDARRGRLYLPRERWEGAGLSASDLLSCSYTDRTAAVLQDWVAYARGHLVDGLPLVSHGPRWLARDVQLFVRGGLAILDNIRRHRYDVWGHSIEVSKGQQLALLARALVWPRSVSVPRASHAHPWNGQPMHGPTTRTSP